MKIESIPVVSVLMSVYKEKPEWLEESINSILNQTFKDFEFIIINDNPEGVEQKEVLVKYKSLDKRIRVVENSCNMGLPKSLNIGLEIAKGEYIARMDADDISLPERFELQHRFLKTNPEYSICGTYARFMDEKSKIGHRIRLGYSDGELKARLLFYTPFMHPSIMARRDLICNLKYNEYFKIAQDIDLWLRMRDKTKFYNIPQILLYYRVHSLNSCKRESKSMQSVILKKLAEERFDSFISISSSYAEKKIFVDFLTSIDSLDKRDIDRLFVFLIRECGADDEIYAVLVQRYVYYVIKSYFVHKLFCNPFVANSLIKYSKCLFVYIWSLLKKYDILLAK